MENLPGGDDLESGGDQTTPSAAMNDTGGGGGDVDTLGGGDGCFDTFDDNGNDDFVDNFDEAGIDRPGNFGGELAFDDQEQDNFGVEGENNGGFNGDLGLGSVDGDFDDQSFTNNSTFDDGFATQPEHGDGGDADGMSETNQEFDGSTTKEGNSLEGWGNDEFEHFLADNGDDGFENENQGNFNLDESSINPKDDSGATLKDQVGTDSTTTTSTVGIGGLSFDSAKPPPATTAIGSATTTCKDACDAAIPQGRQTATDSSVQQESSPATQAGEGRSTSSSSQNGQEPSAPQLLGTNKNKNAINIGAESKAMPLLAEDERATASPVKQPHNESGTTKNDDLARTAQWEETLNNGQANTATNLANRAKIIPGPHPSAKKKQGETETAMSFFPRKEAPKTPEIRQSQQQSATMMTSHTPKASNVAKTSGPSAPGKSTSGSDPARPYPVVLEGNFNNSNKNESLLTDRGGNLHTPNGLLQGPTQGFPASLPSRSILPGIGDANVLSRQQTLTEKVPKGSLLHGSTTAAAEAAKPPQGTKGPAREQFGSHLNTPKRVGAEVGKPCQAIPAAPAGHTATIGSASSVPRTAIPTTTTRANEAQTLMNTSATATNFNETNNATSGGTNSGTNTSVADAQRPAANAINTKKMTPSQQRAADPSSGGKALGPPSARRTNLPASQHRGTGPEASAAAAGHKQKPQTMVHQEFGGGGTVLRRTSFNSRAMAPIAPANKPIFPGRQRQQQGEGKKLNTTAVPPKYLTATPGRKSSSTMAPNSSKSKQWQAPPANTSTNTNTMMSRSHDTLPKQFQTPVAQQKHGLPYSNAPFDSTRVLPGPKQVTPKTTPGAVRPPTQQQQKQRQQDQLFSPPIVPTNNATGRQTAGTIPGVRTHDQSQLKLPAAQKPRPQSKEGPGEQRAALKQAVGSPATIMTAPPASVTPAPHSFSGQKRGFEESTQGLTPGPPPSKKANSLPAAAPAPIGKESASGGFSSSSSSSFLLEGSNERILPGPSNPQLAPPPPPPQSFEDVYSELQHTLQDLTDFRKRGDRAFLGMNVDFATAYSETLVDQGDLATMLQDVYVLNADIVKIIAQCQDFLDRVD